jgi:peptide/nickel transport system permease protein
MVRYLARRLAATIPLLVLLTAFAFALLQAAPGDPAQAVLQRGTIGVAPREQVEAVRASLGLNDPLPVRYVRWLGGAIRGDFGTSYLSGRAVGGILWEVLPVTMLLMGSALTLAWALAIPVGLLAGVMPGTWTARGIGSVIVALLATPAFVLALLGLYLFAATWGFLPAGGIADAGEPLSVMQVGRHLILPALVLGLSYFGWFTRTVEAAVSEARGAMFVQYARARGLPRGTVLRRHVLRCSLIPFVAQAGASLGMLVSGAYVVEAIFSWPGAGREVVRAAAGHDYPVMIALVLVSGVIVLAGNLAADLIVARLDPRVRMRA